MDVASALNQAGSILRDLERVDEAIAAQRRALALDEQYRGAEHPAVARDLCDLAAALLSAGDLSGALACAQRASQLDEQIYGAETPNPARDQAVLGEILRESGEMEASIRATRAALSGFARAYGKAHPVVGSLWNNLGHTYQRMGRLDEGRVVREGELLQRFQRQGRAGRRHRRGG